MTEDKKKRLIVACTVGAVLLAVILLAVMCYQIIAISVQKKRQAEYDEQIAYYRTLNKEGEDELEVRRSYRWIVQRARELGLKLPDDIKL